MSSLLIMNNIYLFNQHSFIFILQVFLLFMLRFNFLEIYLFSLHYIFFLFFFNYVDFLYSYFKDLKFLISQF